MSNKNHICNKIQFKADPQKQYLKKWRFYPTFMYSHLDKWLNNMSREGWHIVHCNAICFLFEKGAPEEKEYFTYGLSTQEGKYNLSLIHHNIEKTYGVKKHKSKINSNENKIYQIVEIDQNKIDIQNDVGYKELVSDRNRLYLQYFLRNTAVFLLAVLILVALVCLF